MKTRTKHLWRRWLTACLVGCLTVAPLGGLTLSAAALDGFEQTWQSFGGEWTFDATGVSLVGDGPSVYPKLITTATYQNFTLEADLVGVKNGGFVFRCGDPATGADSFDGYFVGYDSAYAFFGKDSGGWRPINNGGPDAVSATELPYRERMHWKLEVSGNTFTLYVDDMEKPLIQVFDNEFKNAGGVGIRLKATAQEQAGRIENLTITGRSEGDAIYTTEDTYTLWAKRLVKENPAADNQGKVMLVGTSHVEFWKSYAEDFAPLQTLNFGMGGSWVSHLAGKNDLWLTPYHPRAVVVMTGGNDVTGGSSAELVSQQVIAYLQSLLDDLPGIPIFYVGMFYRPNVPVSDSETKRQSNEVVQAFCEQQENLYFIETTSAINLEDENEQKALFRTDNIHLSTAGYERLAAAVVPVVQDVLENGSPAPTEPVAAPTGEGETPPATSANWIPWVCGGVMAAALLALGGVLLWSRRKPKSGPDGGR